jgi:hypothetical protein
MFLPQSERPKFRTHAVQSTNLQFCIF